MARLNLVSQARLSRTLFMIDPKSKAFLASLRSQNPAGYQIAEVAAVYAVAVAEHLGWSDDRLDGIRNTAIVNALENMETGPYVFDRDLPDETGWAEGEDLFSTVDIPFEPLEDHPGNDSEIIVGCAVMLAKGQEPDWTSFHPATVDAFAAVRPLVQPLDG